MKRLLLLLTLLGVPLGLGLLAPAPATALSMQVVSSNVFVDVFTRERFAGNPLAVLPDAQGLDAAHMQCFACELDLSHESPDAPLPYAVATGAEPFLIVGAMAGGSPAMIESNVDYWNGNSRRNPCPST